MLLKKNLQTTEDPEKSDANCVCCLLWLTQFLGIIKTVCTMSSSEWNITINRGGWHHQMFHTWSINRSGKRGQNKIFAESATERPKLSNASSGFGQGSLTLRATV